jgi:uncharacterized cysteine cluster protein YcgN (CxxCxxCC family)|tara:strand:+ start:4466 stop:4876 length:411 start_codon:yes stop_codon:yes gene_type:complete
MPNQYSEDFYRKRDALKFSKLTEFEKNKICNGCGGKGGWIKAPSWIFATASCDHHDFNYWMGYEEPHRVKADLAFYLAMKKDIRNLPWWRKPLAYVCAMSFYRAVRIAGSKFFNYSDRKKTWKDIYLTMQKIDTAP